MLNHDGLQDMIISEYDFLYLPIDFGSRSNLGYAFLNFTTSVAAMRFYKSFNNFSWKDSMFLNTPKICKIRPARIQGRDGNVSHFKNKYFQCDTDKFLPVLFSPPRNGSTSRTLPTPIGNCQRRRRRMHI
ncbi:protein terminal ear1 homolog [Papaver somniferum]|uniref:protein terminal ear1 homolog n=1 Tax=Papaver somniferum TaxID=3469 RepID=UPI000E7057F0|nr:protein terminal ear1 homolog [Papaver somniferum]